MEFTGIQVRFNQIAFSYIDALKISENVANGLILNRFSRHDNSLKVIMREQITVIQICRIYMQLKNSNPLLGYSIIYIF